MTGPRPESSPVRRAIQRLPLTGLVSGLLSGLRRRLGSPLFTSLPGAGRRRRSLRAVLTAGLVFLLRPWPPFQLLPGWSVGLLLLWALAELLAWLWWPQRSA